MARTETEQLVVSVEARIAAMEKQMARAARTTDRTFTGMENRSKRAARTMEKEMAGGATRVGRIMKDFGAGMFAGIAAGGVAGITASLGAVARNIALIGDEAKRAGLDVRAFQELKFVAEQNRIGVDSLTDGIKELNLRADEFITTGGGAAAEAFQRLGLSADSLKEKLRDPSALFTEIIGKLGQLDRAAQIRIADQIFGGTGGERFVQLIDQGADGIRETIDQANRLGLVMDEQLINKADELDRKFSAVAQTVGTALKTAIVEAAGALSAFIAEFQAMEARTTESIRSRLNFAQRNLDAATNRKEGLPGFLQTPFDKQIETSQAEVDELSAELLRRGKEELRAGLNRQRAQFENPIVPIVPAKAAGGGGGGGGGGAGGGGSRAAAIEAARSEADAVRELIVEMEEELRLVGATDMERATANALRQAGSAATAEQQAQITSLVTAIYAEEEALRKASDAAQEMRDIGREVVGGLISDMQNGVDAADALANALSKVADRLVDMALSNVFDGGGGGGGLGFLGAIFGGGRGGGFKPNTTLGGFLGLADGGYTGAGGKHEPKGIVHGGEYVFSKAAVENIGVGHLEAMHRKAKGYSEGGLVAPTVPVLRPGGRSTGSAEEARSVVEVRLSGELEAQILAKSQKQTVAIVKQNDKNRNDHWQNGGNLR